MRVGFLMAVNEVIKLSRVRSAMLMLFGLPLLLIFLLGNALDDNIKPVKLSLYIGNTEELGQAMQDFLASEPVKQRLLVRMSDNDEAVQADLRSGRADYGFSMPPDFSAQVRSGKGELNAYPGRMVERNLTAEAVINGFVQEIKIRQSAAMLGTGMTASVDNPGHSSAHTGTSPSAVHVGTLVAGGNVIFGHVSSLQYYSVAYLIMFLLFSGMSAAISLTEEREKGTLQRLYAMPVSMNSIVFGKLAGILAIAFIQAAFIVTFTKVIYGVDWGTDYGGIALICLLTSIAAVCLAVIIASFVRSRKAVESIYSMIVVMMTFFSGGMVADLGQTVREIGKFSISHWANEALRQMMSGGSLSGDWQAVLTLSAIAAGLLWITAFRYRKAVEV